MVKATDLLIELKSHNASDLHLKVGNKPFVRIDGIVTKLEEYQVLEIKDTDDIANQLMNDEQKKTFISNKEVDFAVSADGDRFRVNIFKEKNNTSLVARHLTTERLTFEELNLPPILKEFANAPRGLILVTGIAGSGKTTTISSMIDWINNNRPANIITIEDPIEFIYKDNKSIIRQRELGADTKTFYQALKHIVRQDPDVIFIGEIRDRETMDSAMKAAELGNLVFTTLHTINATETINRVIDLYPPHQHEQARILLASSLLSIISLRLLQQKDGGRIPAIEILRNTELIKQHIMNPKETSLIKKAIADGEYYGMQTFNQSLIKLVQDGKISVDAAKETTDSKQDLSLALKDIGIDNNNNNFAGTS